MAAFGWLSGSGLYEINTLPLPVYLVQLPEGRLLRTLDGQIGTLAVVAFVGEGDIVMTGAGGSPGFTSDDNALRFWRVSDGTELLKLEHLPVPYSNSDRPSIRSLVVSRDTTRYAFARDDGFIAVARMPLFLTRPELGTAGLEIHWVGGTGRYQVQQRSSLTAGSWEDAGPPTPDRHATLPTPAAASFIRVLSLPE